MTPRRSAILSFLALGMATISLVGCSAPGPDESTLPVETLYNQGMDKLTTGYYKDSAEKFDAVDRYYPYSIWATKAEVMDIYANYQDNNYDDAITAADHFIELHPGNREAPYAYYIKAISYYEQITDIGRDQQDTLDAQIALQEVVNRFPGTPYARDARIKIDLTRDHLAGKEMEVGRFYEKRGEYVAAIGRFHRVISNFQTTTHVPEALGRLVECYLAIGQVREAQENAAVLGYNFSDSPWYKDSYALLQHYNAAPVETAEEHRGLVRRAFAWIF
jgi:outer membrane protein assembly factor BamD